MTSKVDPDSDAPSGMPPKDSEIPSACFMTKAIHFTGSSTNAVHPKITVDNRSCISINSKKIVRKDLFVETFRLRHEGDQYKCGQVKDAKSVGDIHQLYWRQLNPLLVQLTQGSFHIPKVVQKDNGKLCKKRTLYLCNQALQHRVADYDFYLYYSKRMDLFNESIGLSPLYSYQTKEEAFSQKWGCTLEIDAQPSYVKKSLESNLAIGDCTLTYLSVTSRHDSTVGKRLFIKPTWKERLFLRFRYCKRRYTCL
ncbi:unnamed protein product [Taenia asiatica]|uniref:FERM domain-containing protein n=1 Tax=Taenia asiatica TaxID=60517 RepID=A0A0R3W4T4_TAEAS|nr:unnamed protein product [Taenia asiatica]